MNIHNIDRYIYIATIAILIILAIAFITQSTKLWIAISASGEEIAYIALSIFIYIFIDPYIGFTLISITILSGSINILLKYALDLPRPPRGFWKVIESGPGFPSGHSQVSSSFWVFLSIELKRFSIAILSTSILVSIALSRVFLGVHYWYDVVGGLAIGIAIALAYSILLKRLPRTLAPTVLPIPTLLISLCNIYMSYETNISLALLGLSIGFIAGGRWVDRSFNAIRRANTYGRGVMFIAIIAIALILNRISSISLVVRTMSYIFIALSILSIPIIYERSSARER